MSLLQQSTIKLTKRYNSRYTIREESSEDGVLSTISIKRTQREDSALFTCVATNPFGSDDTSINLIIQERPETPFGLKVLDKKSRTVKLSWQAPYDGNSNLTRYVIEFKPTKVSQELKITLPRAGTFFRSKTHRGKN